MDSSTFEDVWLEATAIVEQAQAKFEADFYAPQVTQLGRMVWESMLPNQREMVLQRKPLLADGVRKMLGGA